MFSKPWICLIENQNKEKKPFFKIASSEHFSVMLDNSNNFRELRSALWNSWSQTLRSSHRHIPWKSCTFYGRQIKLLNVLKMFKPSMKGSLEKLDMLNKSKPLRYITNGNKNKKTNFWHILTPWSGFLAKGQKIHHCIFFFFFFFFWVHWVHFFENIHMRNSVKC